MKQIQNNQISTGKSIPAYGFHKYQEKISIPKVFVISNKKSIG
jgi:hypothetical protein